ncbi:uncharacterized protein LOC122001560 isoform X3 [Zingiber officinale]|uniref:uncharacterized protein LOC122001560 isoform X3 n=1 Tax=Zingiber officinale TaxID=94328 RepID=UPI001C4C017F|nr:uncharacterized protein LOC122001560 isoform X3 [Zingiber officinale]
MILHGVPSFSAAIFLSCASCSPSRRGSPAPSQQNKFEYEKTNLVMAEVERLAMRAIREGRCKMRRHWKQLGGFGNKDSPKRKPYKGEISEKNINNRFNRPLEGAHGSKTLVQHYHTAADPVTGELPSVIDTFEKFFHKGGQWKNDWAAQKHINVKGRWTSGGWRTMLQRCVWAGTWKEDLREP